MLHFWPRTLSRSSLIIWSEGDGEVDCREAIISSIDLATTFTGSTGVEVDSSDLLCWKFFSYIFEMSGLVTSLASSNSSWADLTLGCLPPFPRILLSSTYKTCYFAFEITLCLFLQFFLVIFTFLFSLVIFAFTCIRICRAKFNAIFNDCTCFLSFISL